jgi:hypothetical protein
VGTKVEVWQFADDAWTLIAAPDLGDETLAVSLADARTLVATTRLGIVAVDLPR